MIAIKLADGSIYSLLDPSFDGLAARSEGRINQITLSPARPGAHKIAIQVVDLENPDLLLALLEIDGSGGDLDLRVEQGPGGLRATLHDVDSGAETFADIEPRPEQSRADETSQFQQEQIALTENFFDEDPAGDFEAPEDSVFADSDEGADDETTGPFIGNLQSTGEPDTYDYPFPEDDYTDEYITDEVPQRGPRTRAGRFWLIGGIVFLVLAACFAAAYGVFSALRGPELPLIHQVSSFFDSLVAGYA